MITLRIQNTVLETELRLPCSEAELSQCLREIAITEEPPPKVYVKKVIDPQGFAFLEGSSIDVDEMNYLAKRMDSLTWGETDQLYAIVSQKSYMNPKDLINLTFNLECYMIFVGISGIITRVPSSRFSGFAWARSTAIFIRTVRTITAR